MKRDGFYAFIIICKLHDYWILIFFSVLIFWWNIAETLLRVICGLESIEKRWDSPFCRCPSYYRDGERAIWIYMRLRAGRHEEREEEERKREIGRTAGAFYYISPFISRHFAFRISDNCSHGRGTFIIDFCSHDTIRLLNLLFCENSTCKNAYAFRGSLCTITIWNAFINYVDIKYVALIPGERSHMQHEYTRICNKYQFDILLRYWNTNLT